MAMKNIDWDAVEDVAEYEKPVPGAYIVKIVNVEDVEDKQYLRIEYDFAEGEFKDYYQSLFISKNFWGGTTYRSYKPTALSFFKAFKTALEESNHGYKFNAENLRDMVGKRVGLVLGEEEYKGNDGTIKTRLYTSATRSVKAIQSWDFKVPDLKKLKVQGGGAKSGSYSAPTAKAAQTNFAEIQDDDSELPF